MAAFKDWIYPTARTRASPDATFSPDDSGTWTGSTDSDAIDEPHDAPNDSDRIASVLSQSPGWETRFWYVAYRGTAPLPGVAINKIRIRARFGSQSQNNKGIDVLLNAFLIIAGSRYLHGSPVNVTGFRLSDGFIVQEFSWEWATNPNTAVAFTVADLQTGAIEFGVRFVATVDPFGSSSPEARTTQLFLEYEATSSAGNVEQIRHVLSAQLNQDRVPVRTIDLEVPMQYGDVDILDPIWLAHREYPAPDGLGSREEEGARAPLIVLRKMPLMSQRKWRLTCLDPTSYSCTYWSPMVTTIGVDVQDTGIARIDRGGGWAVARGQTGHVRRPPDRLWIDRLASTPRYFEQQGLAVCGAGQIWHANNGFAVGGPGNTFTGWTVTTSGTGTVVEDTADILFDFLLAPQRRSVKITNGAGASDNGYVARLVASVEANRHLRAFMKYKTSGSGAGRPRMIIRRYIPTKAGATQTHDWLPGTGWTTPGAGQWFLPDNLGVAGAGPDTPGMRAEFWSENIPVGVDACEVEAFAGYSTVPAVVSNLYASGIVKTASGQVLSFARDFIHTTSAQITQVGDDVQINNDPDFAVAVPDQGTVHMHFTPWWDDSELPTGARKTLWQLAVDSNGSSLPTRWLALHYYKDSSTVSRLVLEQSIYPAASVMAELTLSGNMRAAYLRVMKIGMRWVSALGELGQPSRSLAVFLDGQKATSGAGVALLPVTLNSKVHLRAISLDTTTADGPEHYPDGCYRHFRMLAAPMRDEQILRAIG